MLAAWGIYALRRHSTRVGRRLTLLLEALDADDTSLRFPTTPDSRINAALNRIADTLSRLRREARSRDSYFENIIDASATGVIVADTEGHILLTNPAALRLLRRPALNLASSLLTEWPQIADLLINPEAGRQLRTANLSVRTSVFVTAEGERRVILSLDDISSQLEAATVDSWAQMSRVLTHEIMNGIAPVISISDALTERYDGSETYITDGLEAISESSRSLRNFVERYNRITRLPLPEPTDFDPVSLVEQTVSLARTLPRGADALITISWPADRSLLVHADRGQLRQVILNLLKNALEASATRIDITITPLKDTPSHNPKDSKALKSPKDSEAFKALTPLSILIQNNGDPIPADRTETIFTPFFTTRPGGSGIGLSLSRRLIHQNHGTLLLTVPSPCPAFTITI